MFSYAIKKTDDILANMFLLSVRSEDKPGMTSEALHEGKGSEDKPRMTPEALQ
jgi:hypothetical protein